MKTTYSILALGLAALVAPTAFGENYGLANMLSHAPSVAQTIRPTERSGLRAQDLETPARRQARQTGVEVHVVRPSSEPVPAQVNWHDVVQSALRSNGIAPAPVQPVVVAPVRKDTVLDEPKVRPQTARDRLLVSVNAPKVAVAPVAQEKMAPVVSDLSAFRARGLASDTSLPGTTHTNSIEGAAHSSEIGRGAPARSTHTQGYTQSAE